MGRHKRIRQKLDYGYHRNYTHERQLWQDALISKSVLLFDRSHASNSISIELPSGVEELHDFLYRFC